MAPSGYPIWKRTNEANDPAYRGSMEFPINAEFAAARGLTHENFYEVPARSKSESDRPVGTYNCIKFQLFYCQ